MPPARSTVGRGSRVKWKRCWRDFSPAGVASAFMKSSSPLLPSIAEIAAEHVGRHALDHRVTSQQPGHPFAAAGVKHLALAAPEIDDHAVRVADLFQVLVAGVAVEHVGDEAAVLVAEELVLDIEEVGLLDLARHAHRQDFEA